VSSNLQGNYTEQTPELSIRSKASRLGALAWNNTTYSESVEVDKTSRTVKASDHAEVGEREAEVFDDPRSND